MATAKKKSKRLSREDWLAAALEVLYGEGVGKVSIVRIARDMGVTSGSFYWHFKDRNDLLRSLLDFWVRSQTEAIFEKVDQFEGKRRRRSSPHDRGSPQDPHKCRHTGSHPLAREHTRPRRGPRYGVSTGAGIWIQPRGGTVNRAPSRRS